MIFIHKFKYWSVKKTLQLSVKINYKECEGYSNSNDRKSNYNKVKKLKKSREKLNRFLVFPEISIHIIFILALLSSIYALAGV